MNKNLIYAFTLLLLVAACQTNNDYDGEEQVYPNAEYDYVENDAPIKSREVPPPPPPTSRTEQDQLVERKLIKNGFLRFETTDLGITHRLIVDAVKDVNGYISRDEENKGYNQVSHSLEVRIPSTHFDAFVENISKGITHFDDKSIDVRDVTDQFVDLSARLKTKKELENRFLELLKKANSVEDILNIEKEIAILRSDIEAMEGRLRLMNNQISYSTLRIEYYVQELETTRGFGYKFKNSFKNGWENLLQFFVGVFNIWPFILLIIIAAIAIRSKLKRRKK